MKRMEITARIYSSYKLTYSNIYKDVVSRLYPGIDPESIRLEVEDISDNGRRSIQGQRSLKKYVSRTIRVCEDGRLAHIVGISNTNYDLDKKREKVFLSCSTDGKLYFGISLIFLTKFSFIIPFY